MAYVWLVRNPCGGYEDVILTEASAKSRRAEIKALCQARHGVRHRAFLTGELRPEFVRVRVLGPEDSIPMPAPPLPEAEPGPFVPRTPGDGDD